MKKRYKVGDKIWINSKEDVYLVASATYPSFILIALLPEGDLGHAWDGAFETSNSLCVTHKELDGHIQGEHSFKFNWGDV